MARILRICVVSTRRGKFYSPSWWLGSSEARKRQRNQNTARDLNEYINKLWFVHSSSSNFLKRKLPQLSIYSVVWEEYYPNVKTSESWLEETVEALGRLNYHSFLSSNASLTSLKCYMSRLNYGAHVHVQFLGPEWRSGYQSSYLIVYRCLLWKE